MANTRYRRVMLKLSGDFMSGPSGFGIDPKTVDEVSRQIVPVAQLGVQLGIVIGGGNLWRGGDSVARGMDRATADYMGMLGTVMNALALQDSLERLSVDTRVQTAIEMHAVAEPYIRRRAIHHLDLARVVIFGGGIGSPYITTDTAAALRAAEIGAEILLKATKVDGIYSDDPIKVPTATRYDTLSFADAINMGVKVMDATALTLCRDNRVPLMVFKLRPPDSLVKAVCGELIGTIVAA